VDHASSGAHSRGAPEAVRGWTIDPAYGGHGYATEAVRELMRVCFEELRLRRVLAACFAMLASEFDGQR
jgi:RimJ/RimL family protein N-acetyltransferase